MLHLQAGALAGPWGHGSGLVCGTWPQRLWGLAVPLVQGQAVALGGFQGTGVPTRVGGVAGSREGGLYIEYENVGVCTVFTSVCLHVGCVLSICICVHEGHTGQAAKKNDMTWIT